MKTYATRGDIRATLRTLDGLTPPDKATLLHRAAAYRQRGITRLDPPPFALPKPRPVFIRRPLATASTALILLGVAGGAVLGADVYTYTKASAFFEEHGLSTEGLDRDDLWEVYRDITAGNFELPATAYTLRSNMGLMPSSQATAEEIESLWEDWQKRYTPDPGLDPIPAPAIPFQNATYHIQLTHHDLVNGRTQYKYAPLECPCYKPDIEAEMAVRDAFDAENTASGPLGSMYYDPTDNPGQPYYSFGYGAEEGTFSKTVDGERVWSVYIGLLSYTQYAVTDDYILIAGYNEAVAPDIHVLMLSPDGGILWESILDNGVTQELPQLFLCEEETITLFSRTDRVNICRTVFDLNGNLLDNTVCAMAPGNIYTIQQAIPFRDGHLLLMNSASQTTSLYYMNGDGVITDSYGYADYGITIDEGTANDTGSYVFNVDRIMAANGYLYVSITGTMDSGRGVSEVYEWIFEREEILGGAQFMGGEDFSDHEAHSEFVQVVRDCYRSILLVCDPETMEPLSICMMEGAYPAYSAPSASYYDTDSPLAVDEDGNITWAVEAPYAMVYSPATSSFTFAGSSYRYTYTLTPDGQVIGVPKVSMGSGYRV